MSEKFKRDFGQTVNSIDGEPVRAGMSLQSVATALIAMPRDLRAAFEAELDKAAKQPLTLAVAAINALQSPYEDEKSLDAVERMKRFQLALRVNKGGMVKISTEERDKIKKLIYKYYLGSAIAPVCDMLLEGGDPFRTENDDEDDQKLKAVG